MRTVVLALCATLWLSGCAGFGQMAAIDAIAAPDAGKYRTYNMVSENKEISDLESRQYTDQLETVLASKGMTRVDESDPHDMTVFLSTKVFEAKTVTHSGVIPQYGKTGYSSSYTYGSVYGNTYSANTIYVPTYGVTGYTPYSRDETVYPVGFRIKATSKGHLGDTDKEERELWEIRVVTNTHNGDIRGVFQRLLQAATPYIGQDTHGEKLVPLPFSAQ